jgi:hypothetical protein
MSYSFFLVGLDVKKNILLLLSSPSFPPSHDGDKYESN